MPKVNYTKAKGLFQESSTLEGMRIFGETQAITTDATNIGGAKAITAIMAIVTVHAGGGSVQLPEGAVGDVRVVVNTDGANACNVFPQSSEEVDNGGPGTAFSLAASKNAIFVYGSAARGWEVILSA